MAFIFGGDVDQLARQRNVSDQQNVNLAQSDQAARQRAIDIGQQRQIEADQQAQARQIEADQQAQARQDQAFAFARQDAAQQQANQENDFRFNLGRQDQAAATAEDTRRFNVGADLQKQQLASTKGQSDYAEAVNAIENGDVSNAADLDKSFPSLTQTQKQRASMYLGMKVKKQTQDYNSVMAAAQAATGIVAPPFKPVTPVKPHWWSATPEAPKPPPPLTEDEAMAKLSTQKQFLKFLPALTFDESNQRFMPAIPKPEGWQPASGAGTAAPSPQPTAPGVSAPAPFAFNTSAPSQPTVTAGQQPLINGVKRQWVPAGTVYKGHVSKGGYGDDPATWTAMQQVQ